MTARCTRITNSESGPADTIQKLLHSPKTKLAFQQRHSGCRNSLNHKCVGRPKAHQRFCHHWQTYAVGGKITVTYTCQQTDTHKTSFACSYPWLWYQHHFATLHFYFFNMQRRAKLHVATPPHKPKNLHQSSSTETLCHIRIQRVVLQSKSIYSNFPNRVCRHR